MYEEFLASFEDHTKGGLKRSWVKGGLTHAEKSGIDE